MKELAEKAVKGDVKPLLKYAKEKFEKDKTALFKALEEDYDLIFWYTYYLDKVGHFLFRNKFHITDAYLEINQLVGDIKRKKKDAIIYIISDHGMVFNKEIKMGEHSSYGFFSSNSGELIQKPQDLFYLIKEKAEKMKRE